MIAIQGQTKLKFHETPYKPIRAACHLSYAGRVKMMIIIQLGQGKKQVPVLKISKAKWARAMAQLVEHQPRKCKKSVIFATF
jgi:hypothetical protein